MLRGSSTNGFKAVNDTKRPTMYLIIWSYKVVRYRYTFPRSSQNRRYLPRDISLDNVEVLRHDVKRSKSENKGKVPTEMELVLEQTQQGTSYEVSISTEGVEELKRKVKIKGKKKEALLTLRQKPGNPDGYSYWVKTSQDPKPHAHTGPTKIKTSRKLKYMFQDFHYSDTNIKKDGYTRFQHQEQYEHVGPEVTRSQEGKRSQNDDKRLCLVDDLKEVQVHIQVKPIRTSSSLKSKIIIPYSKDDVKKTNLRAQD
ncbi:hypothetical protein Tco_0704104 [Tanacetum coccineum]|uniref:Uncharacterized protein n=1 Tax=Tanacetum coccineum TaxID=301880 RepID=A0ABQ4Y0R1_9ASTR